MSTARDGAATRSLAFMVLLLARCLHQRLPPQNEWRADAWIEHLKPMRYWEDFSEGQVYDLGEETIREKEIVEFARRFDAQPFHVDPEAAKRSIYGGLIASGWHTCSLFMGLLVKNLIHDVASLGAGGVDELRWLKPVRPDDRVRARLMVLGTRPSTKHPDRGLIHLLGELFNQGGEQVLLVRWSAMIARRAAAR